MGFAIASDTLLAAALAVGAGAIAASLLLLAAILVMRLRLAARLDYERRFAERWQPVLASCALDMPEQAPELDPSDGHLFLLHWLRAQESLLGAAQENLNALALRVGADRLVVHYLASGDPRRELLALVAAGHLRLAGVWPLAEAHAAEAEPVVALCAAQTLLRIDSRRALAGVLAIAARRADWPVSRVGAMLRECDLAVAGAALAAAIEAELGQGREERLARLLRLHGALAAEAARPAVRKALLGVDHPDITAAALDALWHPEDAQLARARLRDAQWFVRLAAVKVLGRIGGPGDRAALEERLGDANWWVRYRAAQALARIPGMDRAALIALRAAQQDRFAADMLAQVLSETEAA